MKVPLLDLNRFGPEVADAVDASVRGVFASGNFILGEAVAAFEREFAEAFGITRAVGMSSGTDAELALLMALRIGEGDAVIVPTFTFFATAGCVARLGAEPVFLDVRDDTLHLDPAEVRQFLETRCRRSAQGHWITPSGSRLRAIVPVHLFGSTCEMDSFLALGQEFDLAVIEDAAQAVGAQFPGSSGPVRAGAIAPFGFFSFFPTKNLGGAGDGGMAVCRDPEFAARLQSLRNHGMTQAYRHEAVGGNFRLDALQAAVLRAKLPFLADWNAARRTNAALYRKNLGGLEARGLLRLPHEPHLASGLPDHHTYHQYVVRTRNRDALKACLEANAIGCAAYYPIPLHRQPCFDRWANSACPIADRAASEVLALPIFPGLEEGEIARTCEVIHNFFARA